MASLALTAARSLCRTAGATAVVIASLGGLMWVGPHAGPPIPEEPPGSGSIIRTEVTAVWVPRSLRDLARRQADPPAIRSTEELRASVKRCRLSAAWYALTYRGYQVNGGSAEITQVRRVSEADGRLDELRDVMVTVAGKPPRYETLDFSHARVFVIPDSLLAAEPRQAIAQLRAAPVVEGRNPDEETPAGGRLD